MPPSEYRNPIPLMILSDAPTARSGLARITRDLATRIATDLPQFRVSTLGQGGASSRHLPFHQYPVHSLENWIVNELPLAWADFAGDERGIVVCIWDCSRLGWLINPPPRLPFADWLKSKPFDLWTYSPIDAEGPNGKLSGSLQQTLAGFDRVLNYSDWSARVTGYPDHLPHGIDTSIFKPLDKLKAKQKFRDYGFSMLTDDSLLLGIVATNQLRKDWALGIQTAAALRARGHNLKLWFHTDTIKRHWDINQLLLDYNLADITALTTDDFPDLQMAEFYSACDITLGIGSGEGFGYPLAESLACGTPVIHGNYGGGAEFVPQGLLVNPIAYRHESVYCWKRPVFDPEHWADAAEQAANIPCSLPPNLDWNNLWPKWKDYLLQGIAK